MSSLSHVRSTLRLPGADPLVEDQSNSNWRQQLLHTAPAFPKNVFITPQREELQLTARLHAVSPSMFQLAPPADSDDEE